MKYVYIATFNNLAPPSLTFLQNWYQTINHKSHSQRFKVEKKSFLFTKPRFDLTHVELLYNNCVVVLYLLEFSTDFPFHILKERLAMLIYRRKNQQQKIPYIVLNITSNVHNVSVSWSPAPDKKAD